MNKTVNINLAGMFFHIDEDAYLKLQRYLDVIKRSFTTEQGRDEIIADVEARIAELFTAKIQNDRQVIGMKEVEEVIGIMGKPEDYLVDEAIFEDASKAKSSPSYEKTSKRLYRDTENKYIGGVCAGLSHYLGIDAIWVRLLFILFTIFSGFGLLAYILFWILVPEAGTTAQKLEMRGEPVNLSNIERKVKEGLDNVTESIKSIDYEKAGKKVQSASKGFFDAIGEVILFIFNIFAKFIGIILIIVTVSILIALFIALFIVGSFDAVSTPWSDFMVVVNTTDLPMWALSLLIFFAVGIPFFFLFYLGLKILVNNLKSIGNIAKYTLLGLWLISLMALLSIGTREFLEHAQGESVTETQPFQIQPSDTLTVSMNPLNDETDRFYKHAAFDIITEPNGVKKIYFEDLQLRIKQTEEALPFIKVEKYAKGSTYKEARERARKIVYQYRLEGKTLLLNNFFTTHYKNKYREQEVTVTLYLPAGVFIKLEDTTSDYIRGEVKNNRNYYGYRMANHLWKMTDTGELECLDCTDKEDDTGRNKDEIDGSFEKDEKSESLKIKIDSDGIQVKTT